MIWFIHQSGVSLKSAFELVYPGENRKVREILKNSDWLSRRLELENTFFYGKSKPQIGVLKYVRKKHLMYCSKLNL